tara:strand:- start:29953 stop:30525 length:573 start_codon:yes stop_codon:yes gene_type:complete
MANPFNKNLETFLNEMGKQVMNRSKAGLKDAKPYSKGGGELENSIRYKVVKTKAGYEVQFSMQYYGEFVDKGVSGVKVKRQFVNYLGKKITTDFSYKGKGPPIEILSKWIKRKGIKPKGKLAKGRDKKSGRFVSGLAYLISRKINRDGIQGISFFQKPLQIALKTFNSQVKVAVAKDIRDTIKGINFKNN